MTQWIDLSRLIAFIPMFWVASMTPGMCMTLSMTLGMAIGFKRTLWMMLGELAGVTLLATLTAFGVASLTHSHPLFFIGLKWFGVGYLIYIGITMIRDKSKVHFNDRKQNHLSRSMLIAQGFITAVSNPKGWLFFIALIPPALNPTYPLNSQLIILIIVIVSIELSSLCLYALGGSSMRHMLQQSHYLRWMHRIAGTIIIFVALWLLKS